MIFLGWESVDWIWRAAIAFTFTRSLPTLCGVMLLTCLAAVEN